MNERQAGLRACYSSDKSEREAARLEFYDWLEDQGDPRAEFIRLQLALEEIPINLKKEARLQKQAKALFGVNQQAWTQEDLGILNLTQPLPGCAQPIFRRGFISGFTLTRLTPQNEQFFTHGMDTLELINFTHAQWEQLRNQDWIKNIQALWIDNPDFGNTLRHTRFFRSPNLNRVQELQIRNWYADKDRTPRDFLFHLAPRIQKIDLRKCEFDPGSLLYRLFTDHHKFPHLKYFDLRSISVRCLRGRDLETPEEILEEFIRDLLEPIFLDNPNLDSVPQIRSLLAKKNVYI